MKQIQILLLIGTWLLPALTPLSLTASDHRVPIGTRVPDLVLRDIRGLDRSLSELGDRRATVLVFTNTDCPLVQRYLPELVRLNEQYAERNVVFVSVNVGPVDSIRDMAAQALEFEAPFVFLKDHDLSVARALGVSRTPEAVILNQRNELVYRGRIDDQYRLGGARPAVHHADLEAALQDVLEDRTVARPETPVDGCEIVDLPQHTGPEPTFAESIAPIVCRHCTPCHRPGTAAPFSLLTWEDAAAHAAMIDRVVTDERMPPWYADPAHGSFRNDPSLSAADRRLLLRWTRGERLPGDLTQLPAQPDPPAGDWRIGEPDLVITMLEEHTVPASGFVPYRYTVLPYLFLQDTWVEAVEIRPDNPRVVHHCNLAYVTSAGAGEDTFITGYVPGGQPLDLGRFDAAVACRLPQHSGLGLQIHYTTTGTEERCRIAVGLRFARSVVQKEFRHFLLDPRFRIPPRHPAWKVAASHTFEHDAELLGLFTHMHVRGRDMTFFAERPGDPREILLRIPNYNFEWQLGYEIAAGSVVLPAGTRVEAIAHFDNSAFNPYNPDPDRTVPYGLQTVDEMFNGFAFYVKRNESLNLTIDERTGHVIAAAAETDRP